MKIISQINSLFKKLSYTQKIMLGIVLGYLVYTQLVVVENFLAKEEVKEEEVEEEEVEEEEEEKEVVKVEDEPIKTGLFDQWATNLGLQTDNILKAKRQTDAKKDKYNKYKGDNIDIRKALAIADEYNKYN